MELRSGNVRNLLNFFAEFSQYVRTSFNLARTRERELISRQRMLRFRNRIFQTAVRKK